MCLVTPPKFDGYRRTVITTPCPPPAGDTTGFQFLECNTTPMLFKGRRTVRLSLVRVQGTVATVPYKLPLMLPLMIAGSGSYHPDAINSARILSPEGSGFECPRYLIQLPGISDMRLRCHLTFWRPRFAVNLY